MAENPDTFFAHREVCNTYYDAVPDIVNEYMQEINKLTGRDYKPFTYYGAEDAESIIICMGSVTEATREVIDYLTAQGKKVGIIAVHLYRPFSVKYLKAVLPASVKRIAVLDRTKEPGAPGEPLYLDIVEALSDRKDLTIVGGRYGLGSYDTTPANPRCIANLPCRSLRTALHSARRCYLHLPPRAKRSLSAARVCSSQILRPWRRWYRGCQQNSVKIIGENTDKHCQAYFSYDSKKS